MFPGRVGASVAPVLPGRRALIGTAAALVGLRGCRWWRLLGLALPYLPDVPDWRHWASTLTGWRRLWLGRFVAFAAFVGVGRAGGLCPWPTFRERRSSFRPVAPRRRTRHRAWWLYDCAGARTGDGDKLWVRVVDTLRLEHRWTWQGNDARRHSVIQYRAAAGFLPPYLPTSPRGEVLTSGDPQRSGAYCRSASSASFIPALVNGSLLLSRVSLMSSSRVRRSRATSSSRIAALIISYSRFVTPSS